MSISWIREIRRRGTLLGMHYLCYGMNKYTPYLFGVPFTYSNVLYVEGCLYKTVEDDNRLKGLMRRAFDRDPAFFVRIAERIERDAAIVTSSCAHFLDQRILRDMPISELHRLFAAYMVMLSHFGTYFRFMEPASATLEPLLMRALQSRLPEPTDLQAGILALATSPRPDYVTEERRSLLRLAFLADKRLGVESRTRWPSEQYVETALQDEALSLALTAHAERFSWMATADHLGTSYSTAQYAGFIRELKTEDPAAELTRLERLDAERLALTGRLREQLAFSEQELSVIESIQRMDYVNALVKQTVLSSQQVAEYLLVRVGRKLDASRDELLQLTFLEILDLLRNNATSLDAATLALVQARRRGWVLRILGDDVSILSGDAVAALREEVRPQTSEEIHVLTGTTANPGKVTGAARIANSPDDFPKVRPGDIVISAMTTPEFNAVMDRIAGIVTDEGGITSHAASLARERGIPCLVGTRRATEVLHDGESIELDASAGIVRRITLPAAPGSYP